MTSNITTRQQRAAARQQLRHHQRQTPFSSVRRGEDVSESIIYQRVARAATRSSSTSDDDDDDDETAGDALWSTMPGAKRKTAERRVVVEREELVSPTTTTPLERRFAPDPATTSVTRPVVDALGAEPARADGPATLQFPRRARQFYRDTPAVIEQSLRPPSAPELDSATRNATVKWQRLEVADARDFANDPLIVFATLVAGHAGVPLDSLVKKDHVVRMPRRRFPVQFSAPTAPGTSPATAALAAARDGTLEQARSAEPWLNRTVATGETFFEPPYLAKLNYAYRAVVKRFPNLFDARLRGAHRATPTLRDIQVSRDFADAFARLVANDIAYTRYRTGRGGRFVSDRELFADAQEGALNEFASASFHAYAADEADRLTYDATTSAAMLDRVALGERLFDTIDSGVRIPKRLRVDAEPLVL